MLDSLLEISLCGQRTAEVLVCLGKVGLEFQGPAETGYRLVESSDVIQRTAQGVVGLGIVGVDLQGPSAAVHGVIEFTLFVLPRHWGQTVPPLPDDTEAVRFLLMKKVVTAATLTTKATER